MSPMINIRECVCVCVYLIIQYAIEQTFYTPLVENLIKREEILHLTVALLCFKSSDYSF